MVLGLLWMIMVLGMDIQFCVLIFVVENLVLGNVFRLQDILISCKGLIVEINNIDVEGCLVLVDVLIYVCEEEIDFVILMVILIGVVWVVVGGDFVLFFCDLD